MKIKPEEIEKTLQAVAALGPRHAKYVEESLKPGLTEYLEEYVAAHPGLDLTAVPTSDEAAKTLVSFMIGLDYNPKAVPDQFTWLHPYLAEAAGPLSFGRVRRQLTGSLLRAYPTVWTGLKVARGRPVLKILTQIEDLEGDSATDKKLALVGGYSYMDDQIILDANKLTVQYLLSQHPFPADLPIPLVLGLDPCFYNHFLFCPKTSHQRGVLHALLHECLHASVSQKIEPYRDHLYDGIPMDPALQISEVIQQPLITHLILSDRQTGTTIGRRRLTPQSRVDLMEAVTDHLTLVKIPVIAALLASSIASSLNKSLLLRAPKWPTALFDFSPTLGRFVFPAQAFIERLSAEELASFWNLEPERLENLYSLLRQNFQAAQADALVVWLAQDETALAVSLASGEVARSSELEELLAAGWKAVPYWLNSPYYVSPLSQFWKDL
jgi:hypothetical protein